MQMFLFPVPIREMLAFLKIIESEEIIKLTFNSFCSSARSLIIISRMFGDSNAVESIPSQASGDSVRSLDTLVVYRGWNMRMCD